MIDFHTHILPGIDDGSRDLETSLAMIEKCKDLGVEGIVLTPHFYAHRQDISTFLKSREEKFEQLVNSTDMPLYLGAEVAFYYGIGNSQLVNELKIRGTNHLLLEMPFNSWSRVEVEEVEKLCRQGIVPILAHVERFTSYFGNRAHLRALKRMGCIMQMNAEMLISDKKDYKEAEKLIRDDLVDLIGSDCHNLSDREPNYGDGFQVLVEDFGDDLAIHIENTESRILHLKR